MGGFFRAVEARVERAERVFLALVVENTLHSPGCAGARMAVFGSGETIGSIGGGVMEHRLVARARDALQGGTFVPELCRLVHRENAGTEASGLSCAGEQTNLYYLCETERDAGAIRTAARCEREGEPGRMTISAAGMACEAGAMDPDEPQRALRSDADGWSYSEQLLNMRRVAILGAGHCGLALSRSMSQLGYHVTIVDDRPELSTMLSNTYADRALVVADMAQAAALVDHPELTHLVVMGTDVETDLRSLRGALRRPFPFIGAMGSPAKNARIRSALRKAGFGGESLARITAPVGLAIGSRTPEEIAISVSAQILQRRNPVGSSTP